MTTQEVSGEEPGRAKTTIKPFIVAWLIYVCLMFAVTLVILPAKVISCTDFHVFYSAGLLARTDPTHLYNPHLQLQTELNTSPDCLSAPFIQLPYEALLFAPFSSVSYRAAYFLFLLLNLVLIVPCFLLARAEFSRPIDPWQPRAGFMLFVFLPLSIALKEGQGSVRLLLLCCAVWHELKRKHDFTGGLLLGLSLFKMQVALPLALLLIIWRGRRVFAGFLVAAAMILGVSCWFVGLAGMQGYGRMLLRSTLLGGENATEQLVTAMYPVAQANLRGLLYGCGGKYLPHSLLLGLTFLLSLALLMWTVYLVRKEQDQGTAFAAAIIGALLLSYHIHIYDLTVLLLPIALLAGRDAKYFREIVAACFIMPLLLVPFTIQPAFLMAIPLLGFLALIARGRRLQSQHWLGSEENI